MNGSGQKERSVSPAEGPALPALHAELAALMDRIDTANSTWSPGGPGERQLAAVTQLLTELQDLPKAIAAAMTEALNQQHRLIMGEIRVALRQVLSED